MSVIRFLLKGCTLLILLFSLIWAFKEPTIATVDWTPNDNSITKIECSVVTDF